MNTNAQTKAGLERSAWLSLVVLIAVVPLAVSKLPFLEQSLTFTAFGFPQSMTFIAGIALTLTLWGLAVLAGQARVFLSRSMIAVAALAAWAIVSTATGLEPLRSVFGASTSSMSLMSIAAYSMLFFLAIQLVDSQARLMTLTWTVLGSATFVALLALMQQLFDANLFGLPPTEDWILSRGFSTIGNPDQLGTFLVAPALLGACLFLLEENSRKRLIAGGCFALLLTALTGTLTRGAWLGALAGGLLLLALVWKARPASLTAIRTTAFLGVCIAAVGISLFAAQATDLATRFLTGPPTAIPVTTAQAVNTLSSDRINVWKASAGIVMSRPLTGTGPAAYELGWYPNAVKPSSGGGEGGLADDPHSLLVNIVATMGIPALIAYLVACGWALFAGARSCLALSTTGRLSGKASNYVAWFVAACGLQVSLLVAAVSTPILMYAFLGLAVLLRPTARPLGLDRSPVLGRMAPAGLSCGLALALVAAVYPQLAAETMLARATQDDSLAQAAAAAHTAPWNLDVQKAYFHLSVVQVNDSLAAGRNEARGDVNAIVDELSAAGARQPLELYYPSVSAQVLTQASEKLGDASYAAAAIKAADTALAIMPAHIPTRVNRALALGTLKRYREMAETLKEYWRNELSSAYPGILYAQALALSGDPQQARETFDLLKQMFPADSSIAQVQQQTEQQLQK